MSLTYAIADLHGRFDLLKMALEFVISHAADGEHKIVTLGDYVDRGPDSRLVIQHLMEAQAGGRPLIPTVIGIDRRAPSLAFRLR
jgi:serine/threonine protein phosphatase 1